LTSDFRLLCRNNVVLCTPWVSPCREGGGAHGRVRISISLRIPSRTQNIETTLGYDRSEGQEGFLDGTNKWSEFWQYSRG
jgi:hypothetical protein